MLARRSGQVKAQVRATTERLTNAVAMGSNPEVPGTRDHLCSGPGAAIANCRSGRFIEPQQPLSPPRQRIRNGRGFGLGRYHGDAALTEDDNLSRVFCILDYVVVSIEQARNHFIERAYVDFLGYRIE